MAVWAKFRRGFLPEYRIHVAKIVVDPAPSRYPAVLCSNQFAKESRDEDLIKGAKNNTAGRIQYERSLTAFDTLLDAETQRLVL